MNSTTGNLHPYNEQDATNLIISAMRAIDILNDPKQVQAILNAKHYLASIAQTELQRILEANEVVSIQYPCQPPFNPIGPISPLST